MTSKRSKSIKRRWKATGTKLSLKAWAKQEAKADPNEADLKGWLDVKTHVRTAAVKKAMKEAKSIKRAKPRKSSKDRRRAK